MEKETVLLEAGKDSINWQAIARGGAVLRSGGLVVFPTETVYGLGANALDENAVSNIFEAKGRPADNPLIVHIAAMEELGRLAREVPDEARRLAERFWPGPLTLILPRGDGLPEQVSAGLDTVAVRMPSHPVAQALLKEAGVPVAAPSANRSGSPSPTTARHCADDLMGRVDMILDGGPCSVGLESTVLGLTHGRPRLLRPGAITPEQLEAVIGSIEIDDAVTGQVTSGPVASPGMKYKHYAPKARLILVHGERAAFFNFLRAHDTAGAYALVFDEDLRELTIPGASYGPEDNPGAQGERLFAALRALDATDASVVYVRAPSAEGVGLAVYNRLVRAAGFEEIYL